MKSFVSIFIVCFICACTSSVDSQMDKAKQHFIEEVQYMSEEEALSDGITYYKEPVINISEFRKSLTGRELIIECNRIMKEDEEKPMTTFGPTVFKTIRNVGDIKDFAMKHADDEIANIFCFSGSFTHFDHGYGVRKGTVIYVNDLDRAIVEQDYR